MRLPLPVMRHLKVEVSQDLRYDLVDLSHSNLDASAHSHHLLQLCTHMLSSASPRASSEMLHAPVHQFDLLSGAVDPALRSE